jgi:dienelactone hydrolase
MKKLLGILVLGLLWCNTVFSVDSLSDGKKGTIKFESIPVVTLNQFLKGETKGDSVQISGKLKFPKKKWTGRRPAVVILHGGGGGGTNEEDWAKGLRKIGIATFVLDSNSARGCRKQEKKVIICKNGYLHQGLGHIPDAYRALDLLSTHPLINPNRIALMGFSIGGKAALYASVKRFQKMWGTPGLEFAAYVPFYPGCKTVFENDEIISDRPIRIFFGDTDDFVSHVLCEEYVNRLRKTGADVTITVYPNATHAFDFKPDPRGKAVKVKSGSGVNYRNCRFVEDLSSDRMALE